MSETEPEKKGWFARFRRGTPAVETPSPAEPEVEKPEPVETAVAAESEPEPAPVEAVAEKEPEAEKPEVEKKGWLSRLRDGLSKSTQDASPRASPASSPRRSSIRRRSTISRRC